MITYLLNYKISISNFEEIFKMAKKNKIVFV